MSCRPMLAACLLLMALAAPPAAAKLYSYENEAGDYVISKKRPKNVSEYAVLTDDGEFIELVRPPTLDVPISHWRPWYLPAEPNPLVGPDVDTEPQEPSEPSVIIEEVDEPEND